MEGCRLARYNSSYSMKRCPKCGSGAESTNKGERVFADVVGILCGIPASIFIPAGAAAKKVSENICKYKNYKCTNPQCQHEWSEDR